MKHQPPRQRILFDLTSAKRHSNEEIIGAYRETGSVWKAAKKLGMCGQSVWERLKALDHPLPSAAWAVEELDELRSLAADNTITEIAQRLGRPYAGVACKISELGLGQRYGNRLKRKQKRVVGYTKIKTKAWVKELRTCKDSLRKFARRNGLSLELLVQAIQRNDMEFWREYSQSRTDIPSAVCPNCGVTYHPMSKKQKTCTRRCADDRRRDHAYFGGKRRTTIGLAEGICQLCQQMPTQGLSSHHLIGKENDPDNDYLIALCRGCHKLVTLLGSRTFVENESMWEALIHIVLARKLGVRVKELGGTYVTVDIELLSTEKSAEWDDALQEAIA